MRPPFSFEFFKEGAASGVRRSVRRLHDSRFIPAARLKQVRGFPYDTDEKTLRYIEVEPETHPPSPSDRRRSPVQ